jgi:glycosyltransferase involved in cell wall biosynthesis
VNQTFQDFEIIISDNASTDRTSIIAKEFIQKDNRIRYIKQEKNMGGLKNFLFTLDKAKTEYFMWAGVDDYWGPEFLEKNVKILEMNKNVIGSITDVEFVGKNLHDMYKSNETGTTFQYLIKHLPLPTASLSEKISFHLKYNRGMSTYSVFRTKILKKSVIKRDLYAWDQTIVLNTLKHGDLYIINEILMYRTIEGVTSIPSTISKWRKIGIPYAEIIFLPIPFTFFFMKHFGLKIFLENFKYILKFNYRMERSVIGDLLRKIKNINK